MSGAAGEPDPRSGTLGRILQNAGWLFAGKGLGAVLSIAYLGIVTRALGLEGFGQFALILSIAQSVGTLVAFQTWQVLVKFGMAHLQERRERELRELTGLMLLLDLGGALLGCLIVLAGMGALGTYLGWPPALTRDATLFALVMLLAVRSTAVGILRLRDLFRESAGADAVTPVVRLLGALVALAVEPTVTAFLIAWAAAELATAMACWLLAARAARGTIAFPSLSSAKRALAAHPGLARFAASTNLSYSLEAVTKQFSTVIVGLVISPAAAGQYRLALQLGQGFAKLSDLLSRAVFSELTRVGVGQGDEGLRRLFRQSVRFSVVGAAIIVTLLLLLGKPVLGLVAGPEFAAAYPLLLLLGTAAALDFAGVNFEPALLAKGKAGTILRIRLILAVLLALLLLLFLPRFEAAGAAASALAAAIAGLILFGTAAWRSVHRAPQPRG